MAGSWTLSLFRIVQSVHSWLLSDVLVQSRGNAISQSAERAAVRLSSQGRSLVTWTSGWRTEASIAYRSASTQIFVRAYTRSVMKIAVANADEWIRAANIWTFGFWMGSIQTESTVAHLIHGCSRCQVCP